VIGRIDAGPTAPSTPLVRELPSWTPITVSLPTIDRALGPTSFGFEPPSSTELVSDGEVR
jgi:hypothetical protein